MRLPRKPNVPDPSFQKWINHVHSWMEAQPVKQVAPPGPPSELRIVSGPGQNHLSFKGGQGATSHIILASPNPVWNPTDEGSHIFDIGQSTSFPHVIGQPNVSHFYWVVATRDGFKSDPPVGPIKGTTLGLAVPLTPPSSTRSQPGNVVLDSSTQLPTVSLPRLTRGSRST